MAKKDLLSRCASVSLEGEMVTHFILNQKPRPARLVQFKPQERKLSSPTKGPGGALISKYV